MPLRRRSSDGGLLPKTPERISRQEEVSAVARSVVASCAVQEKQQGETADVHLLGPPCRSWLLSAASASFLLRSFVSACPPRTNDLRPNPVCCFLLVCGAFFPVAQENRRWGWMGSCAPLPPTVSLSLSLASESTTQIRIQENGHSRDAACCCFSSPFLLFSSEPSFLQPICRSERSSKEPGRKREGGREHECVQGGRGQSACVRVCVRIRAPRDLTLLLKPRGYHGAGRLIWPLESKSKESGLWRAACACTHTGRMWRIFPLRDSQSMT